MADVISDRTISEKSFTGQLADWFGRTLVRIGEASEGARCAREAGRLNELTDAQLKSMGLRRDQIVAHAFRDVIHS